MKAQLLSLFVAFISFFSIPALIAEGKADCPDNSCFDTQVIAEEKNGNCTTYTLEISQDGSCRYALSHFSIEILCGKVSNVSNSKGWAMEVGTTDPTTGITGIKIDDIKGFGEKTTPQTFTVTYMVCAEGCEDTSPGRVAYKASTCVHYDEVEVPYVPMTASVIPQDLNCANSADGSVDLTVSGGEQPYSFSWSNGASTEDINTLSAGTYSVTVTDAKGESISQQAVISAPAALVAEGAVTKAGCNGIGSVVLSVSGGTAPYFYSWSTGEATSAISAAAGTYEVTVADSKGCTVTESFKIEESATLSLTISGGENCGDNTMEAQVTGGAAPYSYSWNTGETTSGLVAESSGTYSVVVTDANGCTTKASKEVITGVAPELTVSSVNPSCAYGTNGSIDLTVAGVTGGYSIRWSNGASMEDLTNLSAGTYSVTVTDASGCSSSASVVLSNPQAVFVRHTEIIQPDCTGGLGSISVEALYGTAPYTYLWSNGETGNSINGLEPDVYRVTVTDANGCSSSRNFSISAPSQPQVSISGGSCSTTLTTSVNGGTAPYSYEWNNGETTSSIEITEGGMYEVTVTDANGCSSTQSITATDPSLAINLSYEVQEPTCYNDSNGSIDLTVEGGTGEYTYTWSNGATTEDLSNLTAGTYTVTVNNSSGCSSTATITISSPQAIFIKPLAVKNVSCLGESGSISVEATFGTAPYTYEWSNGGTGSILENLEAGYYTVVVTDANGCSNQRRFLISEESGPQVQISSSGCGENIELTAIVTGGKYPFTYSWGGGESTETVSASPGTYSLMVTDANGCSGSASINVQATESALDLLVSVSNVSCAGGSNGTASLQVNGGVAPYTYDWSDGSGGTSIEGLKAGVYSVNVTDAGGCSEMVAFTVTEPQAISITAVAENSSGCGEPSGSIKVQVNGGTAPYQYTWNTGANTSSLAHLSAGVYTLTVEDAKGCVAIRSFKIENVGGGSLPVASLESCADTVICRGETVSIPVYFSGEGPFTFEYTDGSQVKRVTTTQNPYLLNVQPQVLSTYKLLSVQNSCGEGVVNGQLSIQVSECKKSKICEDPCFSTQVVSSVQNGSCRTITLQVSSNGDCRYALSHFNVAVGCGTVSSASNSMGWKMELNALDPTTGLYGIKVDDIKNFGEGNAPQSFTVTYTICSENSSCQESLESCGPVVAYKAGTCVYYDKATEGSLNAIPQASSAEASGIAGVALLPNFDLYPNPYESGQVLTIRINELSQIGKAKLTIRSLAGTLIYQGTHEVSPTNNHLSMLISHMPSGTFVVSLEVNGHIITKQLYVL